MSSPLGAVKREYEKVYWHCGRCESDVRRQTRRETRIQPKNGIRRSGKNEYEKTDVFLLFFRFNGLLFLVIYRIFRLYRYAIAGRIRQFKLTIADDSRFIVFEFSTRFTAENSDRRLCGVDGLAHWFPTDDPRTIGSPWAHFEWSANEEI